MESAIAGVGGVKTNSLQLRILKEYMYGVYRLKTATSVPLYQVCKPL